MDYASNDREPSLTTIKSLIADLQEKIANYKGVYNSRYSIEMQNTVVADNANNVTVMGNNGTVSCNRYCHGSGGSAWNNELPADWLGAQCLSAGTNQNIGCDIAMVDPNSSSRNLPCLCRRNDTFPYSSTSGGDAKVPDVLYNFASGESPARTMSCSKDPNATAVSVKCLGELWQNAGCRKPPPSNTTGVYSIPGTIYNVDVSGGIIDMSQAAGLNLGYLRNVLLPEIMTDPEACDMPQSLDSMRDDIQAGMKTINTLLKKSNIKMTDNLHYKNANVAPLLKQFAELKRTYAQLEEALKEPIELEGNYEASGIKTAGNFSNYMLILAFTIFMVGSLIYIYKNPEVGNLDLFILAIAVVILLYYLYEYIQQRKRTGSKKT